MLNAVIQEIFNRSHRIRNSFIILFTLIGKQFHTLPRYFLKIIRQ